MLFIETARLNLLPAAARQFVREVQDRYAENHDRQQTAAKRLQDMTSRLHTLDRAFLGDGRITEEQAAERKLLQVDHDAASRRLTAMRETADADAALLATLDRWLSAPSRTVAHMHQPSVEFVDVPLPAPTGDLSAIRSEIAGVIAKRQKVDRAPLSRAEIEARVRSRVAELSNQGRPRITGIDGRAKFDFVFHATKPLTFLAWFDPEGLVKRLLAELPPAADGAMSAPAKRKCLADLGARLLELERLEEALVRATPGAERRTGADVRAILSIDERPRKAAKAAA